MRIKNLVVISNGLIHYLNFNNETINKTANSILRINQLFKFNDSVTLELMKEPFASLRDYPQVEAAALDHTIYLFLDRICTENIDELIAHEYVHVCIASTFLQPCPVWLNEGLAMYISGQYKRMTALNPKSVDCLYQMTQKFPNFYNFAIFVVEKLIDTVPLSEVIYRGQKCTSFADDSLFGINNIRSLTNYR